jgi:hypothetical protein
VFFKLIPRDVFNLIAQQTQLAIATAILKEEVKPTKHNSPIPFELEMIWFYATKVLLGRLKKTTIPEGITAWKSDPQLCSLPCFGKNRFAALNAFTCLDLNTLISKLRHSFRQAVVIGTKFTIDETLFAWIGSSRSRTGVKPPKMHLERKPHKDGLLVYNLATTLQWSQLPYIIDLEPLLQSGALTPRLAAERLINRTKAGHYVLDAAFCNVELFTFCSANNLRCTMSCTSNSSSLWDIAKRDLAKGE